MTKTTSNIPSIQFIELSQDLAHLMEREVISQFKEKVLELIPIQAVCSIKLFMSQHLLILLKLDVQCQLLKVEILILEMQTFQLQPMEFSGTRLKVVSNTMSSQLSRILIQNPVQAQVLELLTSTVMVLEQIILLQSSAVRLVMPKERHTLCQQDSLSVQLKILLFSEKTKIHSQLKYHSTVTHLPS